MPLLGPSQHRANILDAEAAPEDCPVRQMLDWLGDTWSVLVLMRLIEGPARFNTLKRSIPGVSPRMLSVTLRKLEREGFVDRTVMPSVPPQVEYALSPLGKTLAGPLQALMTWANENRAAVVEARVRHDGRRSEIE